MHRSYPSSLLQIMIFLSATLSSFAAQADYVQTNLVSDISGFATFTDPMLKNPWGMSFSPKSPFWISDQGTNVATLYSVNGGTVNKASLTVTIPPIGVGGPTGQVFNPINSSSDPAFKVGTAPALFIFANLNGTISAWNGGTAAQIKVTTPGAVYTGLAFAGNSAATATLYAANGAQNRIDVFNSSFTPISSPGGFANPTMGLVPFNVQTINGNIYVTYAPAGGRPAQISATEGMGAVAEFDLDGNLIRQLIAGAGDHLASPWGIALAPSSFGQFGGDLLVGNFSFHASEINAFDPNTGAFIGTIRLTRAQTHRVAFGRLPSGTGSVVIPILSSLLTASTGSATDCSDRSAPSPNPPHGQCCCSASPASA